MHGTMNIKFLNIKYEQIVLIEKAIRESHYKIGHKDEILNILSGIRKEFGSMWPEVLILF
jgi:hypothetical protein